MMAGGSNNSRFPTTTMAEFAHGLLAAHERPAIPNANRRRPSPRVRGRDKLRRLTNDETSGDAVAYNKPIPPQGQHTKPFWEGAKAGKLMLPRCRDCNRVHWYPRLICPFCHSTNLEWIEGSGKGRLHTFAVQHRAFGGWAEEVPYVTAYIDLDEGDRMMTVLRGVDATKPEEIKIGTQVEVEFEQANDDTFIPFWRVCDESEE